MSPLAGYAGSTTTAGRQTAAQNIPAPAGDASRCGVPASTPLLELFGQVDQAFQAERKRGFPINSQQPAESAARLQTNIRQAVQGYIKAGHNDWRQLAQFHDAHYVRHLVEESAECEMLLICWKRGQASRIHNHSNAHCWLSVLSGGVEELRYTTGTSPVEAEPAVAPRLPGVITATTPCPLLAPAGVGRVAVGDTAYINDNLGLHAVRCDDAACDAVGVEGGVSLHIYAPPIRRVRLYEPEDNRVTVRAPGFFTIRGVEEEHWQQSSHMSSSL